MENVFLASMEHRPFQWSSLGNIKTGRGNLGEEMPVAVYRLMQFTMRDAICKEYGKEVANSLFRESGRLAGVEFAKNMLDLSVDFDKFIANLTEILLSLKIGILRVEKVSEDKDEIVLTVGEDVDCSGLPVTGEVGCQYDEGFLAGILQIYTGKKYRVREIDCWATGDRTCRFNCHVET
jgi:predicted hydrocarbon binding protein